MLNKLANIKWVVEKISHGVRIVAIKKKIEIKQIKEPILAIRYRFLSFLKNVGRAKAKGIKEKLSINAVIVNMVKEITFEAPESAVTRPKSLKKLFQKYSDSPKSTAQSAHNRPHTLNKSVGAKTASKMPEPPFTAVINLAARAGVRYSLENPFIYYTTNVIGNLNLLELCREFGVKKYILASTSSLYAGQKMPFKETLPVNEPISPYAASKKSGEVTCYTYHNLYGIDVTILRYFTVYGPASRPDMCPLRFISWVDQEKPVIIYGDGTQSRDFTYVDDIAQGTIKALKPLGFEIINLGGDKPCKLMDFLQIIQNKLNKPNKLNIIYEPFHPADMMATWADITKAKDILAWQPTIKLEQGVDAAVQWFIENRSWMAEIKL